MAISNLNTRVIKILLISLITILISPTSVQAAGRTGNTVANTILSGAGVPSAKLGLNGDFYLDIKSINFYGPKKNNLWPIPISLKGTTGPVGPSGVDGKNGSSANASAGSAGATGSAGSQGPAGAIGLVGSTGPAGAAGVAGPAGATGVAGPAGATGVAGPTGLTGAVGAVGAVGATGTDGAAGATGATGATGAVGAVGATGTDGAAGAAGAAGATGATGASVPVTISTGSITFTSLINGIAGTSSNSNAFGSFLAGKIYLVDVLIYATNLDAISYPLKIAFTASSGSPTISATYLVSYGSSYRTSSTRPENSIIAKVLVNASAVEATSSLITTVTCGAQTGGSSQKLTVAGDFFIQEIGAIN